MTTPDHTVVIDFETRSAVNLGRGGTNPFVYAMHKATSVWLGAWGFDSDPDTVHRLGFMPDMPDDLRAHVEAGGKVSAHNLSFEYAIWNLLLVPRCGWCPLPLEQCDDTAARGARVGLPRSLEKMAEAVGLSISKDKSGAALMKRMAKPRKVHPFKDFKDWDAADIPTLAPTYTVDFENDLVYEWWNTPDRVEKLAAYCDQDYRVQMKLHLGLPALPDFEHRVWQATMRANIRGVRLDRTLIERACRLIDLRLQDYATQLKDLTGGMVSKHTDLNGMKAWLATQGYETESLDKNVVADLLEDDSVPEHVKTVVGIRAEAGKSSVAKFPAMRLHMDAINTVYDLLVYYGATSTGRWSGSGIQVQNLPARGNLKYHDAEKIIHLLTAEPDRAVTDGWLRERTELIEMLWDGSVVESLSMCLRGAITVRDCYQMVVADYSNIEGRKAAWLAGEDWKLDAFRAYDQGDGPDLYKVAAGGILGQLPEDVTQKMRNAVGKVSELALQFQGGAGAFVSMAQVYRVNIEDYWDEIQPNIDPEILDSLEESWDLYGKQSGVPWHVWQPAEAVKKAWRARHPRIVQAWKDCEESALAALANPGQWFPACDGKLNFGAKWMWGQLFLCMRLPSGRGIFYPNCKVKTQETSWGAVKPVIIFNKVEGGRILRSATYAGDLFQSSVQGSARDVMAHGWLNVEAKGYYPLFSVHDEMASEQLTRLVDLPAYEAALCDMPRWARGLPVTAEGYVSDRFRKD